MTSLLCLVCLTLGNCLFNLFLQVSTYLLIYYLFYLNYIFLLAFLFYLFVFFIYFLRLILIKSFKLEFFKSLINKVKFCQNTFIISTIKKALVIDGYNIYKISLLKNFKTQAPLPYFLVNFFLNENFKFIFGITSFLRIKVMVIPGKKHKTEL